jgi:hypothetical protein
VIVRPGSPETAGTRYLGLAEALDRLRGAQLRGKVRVQRWTLAEREAGLDAARARALLAAADHGFGWRPRVWISRAEALALYGQKPDTPSVGAVSKVFTKPTIRPRLRFDGK